VTGPIAVSLANRVAMIQPDQMMTVSRAAADPVTSAGIAVKPVMSDDDLIMGILQPDQN
jgi:hypothetical protein